MTALADLLRGLDSDADGGDVDSARSKLGEIAGLVDELRAVKGDDGDANRVVSTYPSYIDGARASLPALASLKAKQPEVATYVRTCNELEDAIADALRSVKDESASAARLVERAREIEARGEQLLRDATSGLDAVTRAREDARSFRGD